MGWYVNTEHESKESWLEKNARRFSSKSDAQSACRVDERVVILINNGVFTAAGVCVDERELEALTLSEDQRPKRFYVAKVADLLPVTFPSLEQFMPVAETAVKETP